MVDGYDVSTAPVEKRLQIIQALNRREEARQEARRDQELRDMRADITTDPSYDFCCELLRKHEKMLTQVEGIYFLYKFKRNQWRATQPEGSDLTDEAYRKAENLPVYSKKELSTWKRSLTVDSRYMPRDCDSRPYPNNRWTIEEKKAFVDHVDREEFWIETETARLAEFWKVELKQPLPSHREIQRILTLRRTKRLDEDQQFIFDHCPEGSIEMRLLRLQQELDAAHLAIGAGGDRAEDLFNLDSTAEDQLQKEARRDTAAAVMVLKGKIRGEAVNVDGLGVLGKRFNGSGTSKLGRVIKPSKRLKG
jgi:hypothetical protein